MGASEASEAGRRDRLAREAMSLAARNRVENRTDALGRRLEDVGAGVRVFVVPDAPLVRPGRGLGTVVGQDGARWIVKLDTGGMIRRYSEDLRVLGGERS